VVPGAGGGAGTLEDPFKGMDWALERVQPGDRLLLHAGLYVPPLIVKKSGTPEKPIVIEAAGDGDVMVGGAAPGPVGIRADGVHDVWFQGLSVFRKDTGFSGKDAGSIRIHRCAFREVRNGILGDQNLKDTVRRWWISDNEIEGSATWSGTAAASGDRRTWGLRLTGSDHVVIHNNIRRFTAGIGTSSSVRCANLDILDNDLGECAFAGVAMDGAERNVRVIENRIVNAGVGVHCKSIFGGPVYVLRNVLVNVLGEPFGMEARPSGVLICHNTVLRNGSAFVLAPESAFRNCTFRNNLFVGSSGPVALRMTSLQESSDLDRDGFAGGPWEKILTWDREEFATVATLQEKGPVYRNAVFLDSAPLFSAILPRPSESGERMDRRLDLRLEPGAVAVDRGIPIRGVNEGYFGKAPDLGAFEAGEELPAYGPREKVR
jgi:hypothetical protein